MTTGQKNHFWKKMGGDVKSYGITLVELNKHRE